MFKFWLFKIWDWLIKSINKGTGKCLQILICPFLQYRLTNKHKKVDATFKQLSRITFIWFLEKTLNVAKGLK